MRPIEHLIYRADQIMKGEGEITEDWRDALDIYLKAGELGSGLAYYKLGNIYEKGDLFSKDYDKSLKLHKKALSLGFTPSSARLAYLYVLLKDHNLAPRQWVHFFENYNEDCENHDKYMHAYYYLISSFIGKFDILNPAFIYEFREEILDYLVDMAKYKKEELDNTLVRYSEFDKLERRDGKTEKMLLGQISQHDKSVNYYCSLVGYALDTINLIDPMYDGV